jgi:hypothetical protein
MNWQDRNAAEPSESQRRYIAERNGGCMPVLAAACVIALAVCVLWGLLGCASARVGDAAHYPIPRLLDPVTEDVPDLAEPLP